MSLPCDDEWKNYVEVVKSCSVTCFKVVVQKVCARDVVGVAANVDRPVENFTREE